ncbi:Zinc-finger transcription factor protein [Rutstroemia sp. NJR-2017a BBW]|nr:Zinc-finger transcription factor protein [Rutstroemia sp. NJR-2017a BBW]
MHTNECWACKVKYRSAFKANHSSIIDSRAVCNRVYPRCSRCAKSNKPCEYGLRLSWPKATNKKRSLTYSLQDVVGTRRGFSQMSFINATSWDIQLHDYLLMNQGLLTHEISHYSTNALVIGLGNHKVFAFQRLHPPMALSWLPINLDHEERELLDHCNHMYGVIHSGHFRARQERVLESFGAARSFREFTVFYGCVATGVGAFVIPPAWSASKCFSVQRSRSPRTDLIFQSLYRKSRGSSTYCGYAQDVRNAKCGVPMVLRLIDNADLGSQKFQGKYSRLLDWVEYHMVMSRFSHRHWYKNSEPMKGNKNFAPVEQGTCHSRKLKDVSHCSHEILRHIYIMFEMIRKPTDSLYHSDEYENSLRCLENRITNIDLVPEGISNGTSGLSTAWGAKIGLFKLAALIYLKRASRNFSGTSVHIDAMVERAYILLDELETSNSAFPLLIIGCEARADEQRMRILQHIEKAVKTSSLRSLHELQSILQQIWVQDDLAVDYELDYLNRLDAIISSYQIMPSFV